MSVAPSWLVCGLDNSGLVSDYDIGLKTLDDRTSVAPVVLTRKCSDVCKLVCVNFYAFVEFVQQFKFVKLLFMLEESQLTEGYSMGDKIRKLCKQANKKDRRKRQNYGHERLNKILQNRTEAQRLCGRWRQSSITITTVKNGTPQCRNCLILSLCWLVNHFKDFKY